MTSKIPGTILHHTITACLCLMVIKSNAQDFKPDLSTALFHQRIDEAQTMLLAADGTRDRTIKLGDNDELNAQLTYLLTTRVDGMQRDMEYDQSQSTNRKLGYIRGLADFLKSFQIQLGYKETNWPELGQWLDAYELAYTYDKQDQPINSVVQQYAFTIGDALVYNVAFIRQKDIEQLKQLLVLKYIAKHPEQTMKQLSLHPDLPFADSLIRVTARRYPNDIITYAQARNSPIAPKIEACQDPLVKEMVAISRDKSGQLYFPFLDKLSAGTITRSQIQQAVADSTKYYSLLVQTEIDYASMMMRGDTPLAAKPLYTMLKQKSMEVYVNTINGLHDLGAPIRFKSIQQLNAQELYYLIVCNEAEIYTSSYMYVYQRMFQVFSSGASDSLLQSVNYDRYKKFLTMSSNYNTLDNFLSRMKKESANTLMVDFVSNLEKGRALDDIEDAVDVANAFATIKDTVIQQLMLDKTLLNYQQALASGNEKARVIYDIERQIMASAMAKEPGQGPDLTKTLGIPPVFETTNQMLRDSMGRIVLQMYFYGDAGGKGTFNSLVNMYSNRPGWKTTSNKDWVMFSSTGSKVPFVLFANRALDEEQDLDEQAQRNLNIWMGENGYAPSITVHRGHSYYLPYTIDKMWPTSKVVVLGSCGAYHSLDTILRISPDAYIISSKQVGYGEINTALFTYLVDKLKNGEDIAWPKMMGEVGQRISAAKKEGYDDYVFPHQNLGAIFIKAYRKALDRSTG